MSGHIDVMVPLFVPGDQPELFAKAVAAGADAIVIDLEDAVADASKDVARAALPSGFSMIPRFLRVNALGTKWHEADMAALPGKGFSAIVVPKAEATDAFATLCQTSPLPLIALVESARGVADARRIATMTGVARLAFGSIDYCADLGCAHDREALLAARSELVLASRLAGLTAPIDGVTTALDDAGLVTGDARHARDLGFGGKLCIHPRQIEAIREGFAPRDAEIAWARKVVSSGDGAVAVDGALVDEPVRVRARAILRRVGDSTQPAPA